MKNIVTLLILSLAIITVRIIFSNNRSNNSASPILSESRDAASGNRGRGSARNFEVRVETRTPSGLRVESRSDEGKSKVDVFERGRSVSVERRNESAVVQVENEEEEVEDEFELDEGEKVEVETEDDTNLSVTKRGAKFVITDGTIEATTKFPLSIDLATNELIVTTPAGVKRVTVLPQTAVDNMIRVGHVHLILPPTPEPTATGSATPTLTASSTPEGSPEGTPTGTPEATPEATPLASTIGVEIVEKSGRVVYRIRGARRERFLGIIEVLIPKTLEVSADTGQLISTEQTTTSKLIDLLSF